MLSHVVEMEGVVGVKITDAIIARNELDLGITVNTPACAPLVTDPNILNAARNTESNSLHSMI